MKIKISAMTKGSTWVLDKPVLAYEVKLRTWTYEILNLTSPGTLPAGLQFTVPDKMERIDYHNGRFDRETREYIEPTHRANGVAFMVKHEGSVYYMLFSDLCESISVLSQPKVISYRIRDKNTGLLYVNEAWHGTVLKNSESTTPHPSARGTCDVIWAKSPGSAKVFKDLGKLKLRALMITGYYNGTDSNLETYNALTEIPDNWEVVEYEKVSNTLTVLDLDLKAYTANMFRTRDLMLRYGSAFSTLYRKLEKKNELQKYKYMVSFNIGDVFEHNNADLIRYHDASSNVLESTEKDYCYQAGADWALSKESLAGVKAVAEKGDLCSYKTDSICIAVDSPERSFEIAMAYSGKLHVKMLDLETLEEKRFVK